MKIVLLRHGRPLMPPWPPTSAAGFGAWIDAYDEASLDLTLPPPPAALAVAGQCRTVVCSPLNRSLTSARALAVTPAVTDRSFREVGLPHASWTFPLCPPKFWLGLFGSLRFMGYQGNAEPLHEARQRAVAATQRLMELAGEAGPVLLVGHGLFNRFVARELCVSGFTGPKWPASQHWGFSVYENAESETLLRDIG